MLARSAINNVSATFKKQGGMVRGWRGAEWIPEPTPGWLVHSRDPQRPCGRRRKNTRHIFFEENKKRVHFTTKKLFLIGYCLKRISARLCISAPLTINNKKTNREIKSMCWPIRYFVTYKMWKMTRK